MQKLYVFILRGGFGGWDGFVSSAGIGALEPFIHERFPEAVVTFWNWNDEKNVATAIRAVPANAICVVVGYSGGGWKAAVIATEQPYPKIDLLVGFDPSPKGLTEYDSGGRMRTFAGTNVRQALCFWNEHPMMWWPGIGWLGGGRYFGPQVETERISQWHPLVQSNPYLHQRTIEAIRAVVKGKEIS